MRYVLVIILACCMQGCNNTTETRDILKKEKMQDVLWDFIQADAFTTGFIKKDSGKNAAIENAKLQQQIFAVHHITKEVFYKSYAWYSKHYDIMRTMLDSISAKAERDKNKMNFDPHAAAPVHL